MQLLEALACGSNTHVTEHDILAECGSIMGYLECMDEMMRNDILTESVVMEGIDVKGIFKKVVAFIKSIIGKAKQLITKVVNFFKGKKGKLKKVSVPGDDTYNSKSVSKDSQKRSPDPVNNTFGDDGDFDENSQAPSVGSNNAQIGERTRDDLIKELFERTPYSGPWPGTIIEAHTMITTSISHIYARSGDCCYGMANILILIARGDYEEECIDRDDIDVLNQGIQNILRDRFSKVSSDQDIIRYITMSEEGGRSPFRALEGKLTSVQDVKKIPIIYYEYFKSQDGYSDLKTRVFDAKSYNKFVDVYNSAVERYDDIATNMSRKINNNKENLDEVIKCCDKVMLLVDNYEGIDRESLTKACNIVQHVMGIATQCMNNITTGLVEFTARIEADLSASSSYINMMNSKLKSIGYNRSYR